MIEKYLKLCPELVKLAGLIENLTLTPFVYSLYDQIITKHYRNYQHIKIEQKFNVKITKMFFFTFN